MRKGMDEWERAILDAIQANGYAWVEELANAVDKTVSAKQAANRAAHTLKTKGMVGVLRYASGKYRTLAYPPGKPPIDRPPYRLE